MYRFEPLFGYLIGIYFVTRFQQVVDYFFYKIVVLIYQAFVHRVTVVGNLTTQFL